ncbi:MAG TPA: hypothetical protein VK890_02395 [Bacteroidia bacterium]|nr:hypothetical protein [Bacteroidia bacterium]
MKYTILIISILLCHSYCNAQGIDPGAEQHMKIHHGEYNNDNSFTEQQANSEKQSINNTSYIFEGTVIEQKCYEAKEHTLTCSVVQITKIYKGSSKIKCGTIKVITNQSGKYITIKGKDTLHIEYIIDHSQGIYMGETYIILGNPVDSTITTTPLKAENALKLEIFDLIELDKNTAIWRRYNHKTTLDSLYTFFNENGLVLVECKK